MGRAEDLFGRLTAEGERAIDQFIEDQQAEELFLEFTRSADNGTGRRLHDVDRQNLAKAVSGFGNSEGGVPEGGRLRSRHAMVHGLDRLTAFLSQTHVPTPEIEPAWRALATRRVHSIPRVGLTPAQLGALGL